MERLYLDHTATTPLDERVFEAMRPYFSGTFGNASSIHAYGRDAKMALEKARESIAKAIGAQTGEIFFTSGGTEGDNVAIQGVAAAGRKLAKGHIITSSAEHHAVLETFQVLSDGGFHVTIIPVDQNGLIPPEQLRSALTSESSLVSLMLANNEVGTINPVKELAAIAHDHGALIHSDAVQALGKVPIDVNDLGIDVMTISAHKLYGPKGIGALYIKRGTDIPPMFHGGGQERGKRPGTENVPLAVGFAKAAEISVGEMDVEMKRLTLLRDLLEARIKNEFPAAIVNGHPHNRLPHILNVSFDSSKITLEGEMLVMNMDLAGIAVSSGSACTSGSVQPSHVLLALGRDMETAKATLRFAFGKCNREDDVERVVRSLHDVIVRMTK